MWRKHNGINVLWIVIAGIFNTAYFKKIMISHSLWKSASSLWKSHLSFKKVDLFLSVCADFEVFPVLTWFLTCKERFLLWSLQCKYVCHTWDILTNFFLLFCRVPEDCHGNSNRLCDNGIYWFLCQIDPYPNQQYNCVSEYGLQFH